MSVPKQRHTKGRKNRRRSNIKLLPKKLVVCSGCKKMIPQHLACAYCGNYKGKKIKEVKLKTKKKSQAKKEK